MTTEAWRQPKLGGVPAPICSAAVLRTMSGKAGHAQSILTGGHATLFAEAAIEIRQIRITAVRGDVGDALVRIPQQSAGGIDA